MATADEILAGAVEATSEGATQDKVLRIDNELRTISIPSTVKLLGVESDKDVNVIEFEMPRHYGEVDLSTFSVRVNYMNANGDGDIYKVTDLVAGEEKMTFSWLVGRTASMYKGDTRFVVCLKKIAEDSTNKQEFNTTIASLPVLQGLEPDEQLIQRYPDIIEQILKFMETPISPEEVGKAVEEYLKKNPIGGATINDEEVSAGSVWSSQKTSTQIDGKVSDHNIDPTAHTDVRELISGLTNRLNALADSDDTTLDQLSEIVAYIKSNKTLIDAITTSKVSVSDIVDDLITNSSNKPLSAAQGVKLKALIDAIVPITVDSVLSSTSTNPVQNRVVLNGLNEKENKGAARGVQIGSNSYTPNESGVIDLSGALSDTKVVLYTAQTLEDTQKTQARQNIGAADEETVNQLKTDVDAKINKSDALTLEEIEASTDLTGKVARASVLKDVVSRLGNAYIYSISTQTASKIKIELRGNTTNVFYFGAFNLNVGYMMCHLYKRGETATENSVRIKTNDVDAFESATIEDNGQYATINMHSAWCIGTLISNQPISFTYV